MNGFFLDFEKPILELEQKIKEMREFSTGESVELSREIAQLERRLVELQREIYSKLTPWQRVRLARHPQRPQSSDYLNLMLSDFVELHGDRSFADDKAVLAGFGRLEGRKLLVVGQQKGHDTKERQYRNFGMCHPEGYRKALRLMQLAGRFGIPILVLIDTPGAHPGIGAEERGQAEAIARNLREMTQLPVPIVIGVIGEGASGGALGIGVGDIILMLENTWYSVISPEGCAAILWKDEAGDKYETAAEALRLTAEDLMELEVIDKVIPEPLGGAHRNHGEAAQSLKREVLHFLEELARLSPQELITRRIEKFRSMGVFRSESS
jgi:acetyl-CoA carboxylase carboxyl transferase subunit alpha